MQPLNHGPIVSLREAREQGLLRYFTGRSCKNGHMAERQTSNRRCIECHKQTQKEWVAKNPERQAAIYKKWRLANLDQERQRNTQWCAANRDKKRVHNKTYRQRHRERLREWLRRHYAANREAIRKKQREYARSRREAARMYHREYRAQNGPCIRAYRAEYYRRRRDNDPVYAITNRLRCRTKNLLKSLGANKAANTKSLLGCEFWEAKEYLERKFKRGMTWENYGKAWHIDHIRPCASFDLSDPSQQRECFHISNLQPLWAIANIKKGARWDGQLQLLPPSEVLFRSA